MPKIAGDPKIVATNGNYMVIKRGKYYSVIKKGESIFKVKKWRGDELLHSMLIKGGYTKVDPPKDYTEKEEK
jgi:hypothetical protein